METPNHWCDDCVTLAEIVKAMETDTTEYIIPTAEELEQFAPVGGTPI